MKKKRIATLILLLSMLYTCCPVYAAQQSSASTAKTEKSVSDTVNEPAESKNINTPPESECSREKGANNEPKTIEEPTTIPAKSIEIGEYEKEIEVDGTTTISATVYPTDATEQTVTYRSSDPTVATVSSDGTVKGVSAGKVTISITAGDVAEKVTIHVIVKGKSISLNQTYIVLKPDTSFDLDATLFPTNATYRNITYKSLDENIATVSSDGVITAHSCGTGTITVSSKDVTASVTVIVNLNTSGIETEEKKNDSSSKKENKEYPSYVEASEYPFIEPAMLKYYYDNSCQLTVQGKGYQFVIDGWKIKNYNNPLKTDIDLHNTEQGVAFNLNDGESLCGEVTLLLDDAPKHLYIYNVSKDRYQKIQTEKGGKWQLNSAGTYLLTDENLNSHIVLWWIIFAAGGVSFILLIVYIIVKKKYWFW